MSITLRFKNHKSTTLLHVDPTETWGTIRTALLKALQQTHRNGILPTGAKIPNTAEDVHIAQPVDIFDYTQGWKQIPTDKIGTSGGVKGKGMNTPRDAGIKDGGVVAYKFVGSESMDDEDTDDNEWDVVIPTYDDQTDTTNEGDVGGISAYDG